MATICKVYFSTDPSIKVCVCELPNPLRLSEIEAIQTRAGHLSRSLKIMARRGETLLRIIGTDGVKPDLFRKNVQSLLQQYDLQIERVRDRTFFDL